MKVSDIMSSPVFIMGPDEPISRARNLMFKHKISTIAIIEEDKLLGIVSKSDFSKKIAQAEPIWRRRPIDKIPVSMIMVQDPLSIYPEATISQAGELMLENNINYLAVKKNKLVGIITGTDIVKYISQLEDNHFHYLVEKVMSEDQIKVHRHHTINHVVEEMEKNNVEGVVVVDDMDKVIGIISVSNFALNIVDNEGKSITMNRRSTEDHIVSKFIREFPLTTEDIMSDITTTIQSNESVIKAARLILEESSRIIPVKKDEQIIGIIGRKDLMKIAQ